MRDLAETTVWRRFRYPWSSADDLQYPVVAHRDRRHLSWRARDLDVIAIAGHDPLSVALYGRRTGTLFDGDNLCIPGVCKYTSFQRSAPPSSALWILRRTSWWRTFSAATSKNQKTPLSGYPIGQTRPVRYALRNFIIWPVSRNGISVRLN